MNESSDSQVNVLDPEDGSVPMIQPMRKRDLKEFRGDGGVNTQIITSMDMDQWEVLRVKEGYIQKKRKALKGQG